MNPKKRGASGKSESVEIIKRKTKKSKKIRPHDEAHADSHVIGACQLEVPRFIDHVEIHDILSIKRKRQALQESSYPLPDNQPSLVHGSDSSNVDCSVVHPSTNSCSSATDNPLLQSYSAPAIDHSAPAIDHSAPAIDHSAPAIDHSAPAIDHSAAQSSSCSTSLLNPEALQKLQDAAEYRIAKGTRDSYRCGAATFIKWLCINYPDVVSPEFKTKVQEMKPGIDLKNISKLTIRSILDMRTKGFTAKPIIFEYIYSGELVGSFIVELRDGEKSSGGKRHPSTIQNYRSAIANMFYDYGVTVPPGYDEKVGILAKSAKKYLAHQEERKLISGKRPLEPDLYRWLAMQMYRNSDKKYVFAHAVLVIGWQLMCRIHNCIAIRLSDMDWDNDALTILFAHTKTDQTGEKCSRFPRHIYANIEDLEQCPILSLGVYMICTPVKQCSNRLFYQTSASFRTILDTLLGTEEGTEQLKKLGRTKEEYGSHSIRKGSATFAGGITGSPVHHALRIRGGWAGESAIVDGYVQYNTGGDQEIGRYLAGMNYLNYEFATSPPYFMNEDEKEVQNAITMCFPGIPLNMNNICRFLLASLVYHSAWLKQNLAHDHVLFLTPLFTQTALIDRLKQWVVCRPVQQGDTIKTTGVPVSVLHLWEIRQARDQLNNMYTRMDEFNKNVVEEIRHAISESFEEKAVESGSISRQFIEQLFTEKVETAFAKFRDVDTLTDGKSEDPKPDCELTQSGSSAKYTLFMWQNRLHSLPEDYELPNGSVMISWQHYCCGNQNKGYPPLRIISPVDMSSENKKKRFSEFRFLMGKIEEKVREQGKWKQNPSVAEVNEMLESAISQIGISDKTKKNKPRSLKNMSWTSAANYARGRKKNRTKKRKRSTQKKEPADEEDITHSVSGGSSQMPAEENNN